MSNQPVQFIAPLDMSDMTYAIPEDFGYCIKDTWGGGEIYLTTLQIAMLARLVEHYQYDEEFKDKHFQALINFQAPINLPLKEDQ